MLTKEAVKKIYLLTRALLLRPLCLMRPQRTLEPDSIRDILFLRHDRIGDMALSLPAIKLLKNSFPHARLTVVASGSNKDILSNNPYVDEVLVYNGMFDYIKHAHHRRFDLAIDPFHNNHELKPAFMTFLSGARYRIGFAFAGRELFFSMKAPLYDEKNSFIQIMMLILSELGIEDDKSDEPLIFITPDEKTEAEKNLSILSGKRLAAIHPGAFYPSQRWPIDRFAEIAKELSYHGFGVIFFAPAKEFPDFDKNIFKDSLNVLIANDMQMRQFIALLSLCEILICNNSGPLHIACALKIKTVSIMGPTVPAVWRPHGKGHTVIRRDYPCSPCNKAICKTHECMVDITVKEVIKKVYDRLSL
ncbi:MAG: glycosyltransferase family 9 protein [Deltaproteobacteria bacterium]|nr:glycosyltransferase family 9 protein [Deltaproteobacteria bacterium]